MAADHPTSTLHDHSDSRRCSTVACPCLMDMKFVAFLVDVSSESAQFQGVRLPGCGPLAAVSSGVTRSRRCTSSLSSSSESRYHGCGPFLEKLAEHSL